MSFVNKSKSNKSGVRFSLQLIKEFINPVNLEVWLRTCYCFVSLIFKYLERKKLATKTIVAKCEPTVLDVMANDREVLREIWDGKLPICFQLTQEEIMEIQQPDPFYVMVPRLSYFPLVTDKMKRHFLRFISQENSDSEMWLDYNGQPLKWHYPIGFLYDLFCGNDPQLPWTLTVHFTKFPEDILLHCTNKDVVEAHYMSTVKEADVLKHRGQVMSTMQKKDHNQLWLGLQNDKFDQFWAINRRLMESHGENEGFKHIPIRIYFDDGICNQRLVSPKNVDGSRKNIQQMISELYPDKNDVKLRAHGITLPLDTPLQWLSEHMSYPDNFLHLCVC